MKKITFLLLSFSFFSFSQNTYVPDDLFEQALIDQGYDSGPLDDYVPTANINSLTSLSMSSKGIADLTGIEDFTSLTNLLCWNNNLTALDLSQNLALISVKCNGNQLTELDLTNNTALVSIKCYNNLITELDVSHLPNLDEVRCEGNQLTQLNVKNGNNGNIETFRANGNPNLNCIEVDDVVYSNANWTEIDSQTVFSADCESLSTNEFDKNSLITLYPNPTKNVLNISAKNVVNAILVYNVLGEIVAKTSNKNQIRIAHLKSGMYLVKIETEHSTVTKKIIRE